MRYYIRKAKDSEVQGPFEIEQLAAQLEAATISFYWEATKENGDAIDQVRQRLSNEWFSISTIADLGYLYSRHSPQPIPKIDIPSTAIALSSKVCPCCGSKTIQRIPARKVVSVSGDRRCNSCGAEWSPPVSKPAAYTLLIFMGLLSILCVVCFFAALFDAPSGPACMALAVGSAGLVYGFIGCMRFMKSGGGALDVYHGPRTKMEPEKTTSV